MLGNNLNVDVLQTTKLQLEHQLYRFLNLPQAVEYIGVSFVDTDYQSAVTRVMISARAFSASAEVSSLRLKSYNSYIVLVLMSTRVN